MAQTSESISFYDDQLDLTTAYKWNASQVLFPIHLIKNDVNSQYTNGSWKTPRFTDGWANSQPTLSTWSSRAWQKGLEDKKGSFMEISREIPLLAGIGKDWCSLSELTWLIMRIQYRRPWRERLRQRVQNIWAAPVYLSREKRQPVSPMRSEKLILRTKETTFVPPLKPSSWHYTQRLHEHIY